MIAALLLVVHPEVGIADCLLYNSLSLSRPLASTLQHFIAHLSVAAARLCKQCAYVTCLFRLWLLKATCQQKLSVFICINSLFETHLDHCSVNLVIHSLMCFISLLCIIESYIILIEDKVTHLLKYKQEVLVLSMRRKCLQCK